MIEGLQLINSTFSRLGLEMHPGKGETVAKTEVVYIPGVNFYNSSAPDIPSLPQEALMLISPADDTLDNDSNSIIPPSQRIPKTQTVPTMLKKEREKLNNNSPITNRAHTPDGFVDFCKHFKYLGLEGPPHHLSREKSRTQKNVIRRPSFVTD